MHFRHIPRHRPPWWPDDEPWPPTRPPWKRGLRLRHGFLWRAGGLIALMSIFTAGGCALAFWLGFIAFGMTKLPSGSMPFLLFGGFVAMWVGVALIGRAFRRVAAPIDDLMEAAGRVEAGDYSVRVAERGPREVRDLARAFNAMTGQLQLDEEQRRNLLADVTHELRTPLTVMQGNLEALLDGVYPRDDEHLAPILEETRVLSRLVDDLRILSLAESGALKLHRELTDLGALIEETLSSFRAQSDSAGVELVTNIPVDVPSLELDPVRIREVLANLIANALRYTPSGGKVEAVVSVSGNKIAVSIRDTGTGIPPEDLPHIFDRFYRSEQSRGMGLGLAIAKYLVAAHNGKIVAESEPGKGTAFRFLLPLS